jgi:hypothetical protein
MKTRLILLLAIILNSCSTKQEDLGSINIEKLTDQNDENGLFEFESKPIHVKSGDRLYFWSKIDMEYEGVLEMQCQVQVLNEKDEILEVLVFDPLIVDTTTLCNKTTISGKSTYSCTGRIHNYGHPKFKNFLMFAETGVYHFIAIMYAQISEGLEIEKSLLLIKK